MHNGFGHTCKQDAPCKQLPAAQLSETWDMVEDAHSAYLSKTDERLKLALASLTSNGFIGQLPFTQNDYENLSRAVRDVLQRDPDNLKKISDRVMLVLMIFCARYEDTSVSFWSAFLHNIGLPNDSDIQKACREKFRKASLLAEHLHFPSGGYEYVTKILYHAIIPQSCVSEMAGLLRKLDSDAGWDLIAEMNLEQLEAQLPEVASRAHLTRPLKRFVSTPNSRRLATKLVRDLCEMAYLHQRGVFLSDEIEKLIEDNPVQREVWESLIQTTNDSVEPADLRPSFSHPRWQWDVKARRMRLYFPRQRVLAHLRPATLFVKEKGYPVRAQFRDNKWEIEPLSISNLPIEWSSASPFAIELRDERGEWLRQWKIQIPQDGFLFFRPNLTLTIGELLSVEKGLPQGDCLAMLHQQLQLYDAKGSVRPTQRLFSPQGFEQYDAYVVNLQPPVSVRNAVDEILEDIHPAAEDTYSLKLAGNLLPEANDPGGLPVFAGEPPELLIDAERFEELKKLLLQWRALTETQDAFSDIISIDNLSNKNLARWSDGNLRVSLKAILPEGRFGRFRIKLLHGLQSARYAPAEFILVPEIRISPSTEEIESHLYTIDDPLRVQIFCADVHDLTSDGCTIDSPELGVHIIEWDHCAKEHTANLCFENFTVPLRWHPHILRAGIVPTQQPVSWANLPLILSQDALTFQHMLHIEGFPKAEFEIKMGGSTELRGWFDFDAYLQFHLARFSDSIRDLPGYEIPVQLNLTLNGHEYQLPLLNVMKSPQNGRGGGVPIAKLRVGQKVVHRDYGEGVIEAFTEKSVNGWMGDTGRFSFPQYEGVDIFIPTSSRIPIF